MSVADHWYLDIFTTAIEGGINYWAQVETYHWTTDGGLAGADVIGFYADIIDVEHTDALGLGLTSDVTVEHRIDRNTIMAGLEHARTAAVSWSTEPPPFVFTRDTDWDFDAGDADMIVQLGLFGEVIYG